jgi:Amino acid permease/Solute carrier family 12
VGAIPFWAAFAIFFPAVTGFTQGVSMSGDLANPSRSIPTGVLTAVLLSTVVYMGCAVLFAANVPGDVMRGDYTAMKRVAYFAPLIDAGVVAATLSSALASFMGAPRILQSLAGDRIFKMFNLFAQGEGPSNNPRRAVLLTLAIAAGVVILGDLNAIASLVSMFFLISYGLLNYATYMEARSESPSFRPTFKLYHPRIGLLGAIVCGLAMFEIDQLAGAAAIAIMFGVHQYVEKRAIPARFFDSRRSHHLYEARQHLVAASEEAEHPLNWRPQLLVFSDDAARRKRLLRFSSWIQGRSGLTTVARILTGRGREMIERRRQALADLNREIEDGGITAFPLVVVGESLDAMISAVVQATGIGPLRANTVVVNWMMNAAAAAQTSLGLRQFSGNLRTAFRFGCNLLVLDAESREWEALDATKPKDREIDIWWHQNSTGELMLLLAHLIRRDDMWSAAKLRVLTETNPGESEDMAGARLEAALAEYRINAEIVVCRFQKQEIVKQSSTASLVFLPFSIGDGKFYGPAGANMTEFLEYMPVVVMVMAAQDVDLDAPRDSEDDDEEAEQTEETPASESDTPPPVENQS